MPILFLLAAALILPARVSEQQNPVTDQAIQNLKNRDPRVRWNAAERLGNNAAGRPVTDDERRAIPALVSALKDPNSTVREAAAFALGNIGSDGKTVVPALVQALNDNDPSVRDKAVQSLGRIHEDADLVVPALMRAWVDSDSSVERDALTALISFGPDAAVALPDLMKFLKSDSEFRWRAARVIAAIGPRARNAAPLLLAALKDESGETRLEAAAALAAIGVNKSEALPVPLELLRNEDENIRARAAGVLGAFGAPAQAVVPALTSALTDESPDVRRVAAFALSRIARDLEKSRATDAVDTLRSAQAAIEKSSDPAVRRIAGEVAPAADTLEAMRQRTVKQRVLGPVRQHPRVAAIIAAYVGMTAVWIIFFLFSPVSLLRINEATGRLPKVKLPGWLGGVEISIGYLTLAELFHYRDRVLSAWVKQNVAPVSAGFEAIATNRSNDAALDWPVIVDGHELPALKVEDLRPTFQQPKLCVLISGDNRRANSLMACQIGRWAMESDPAKRLRKRLMLPILLQEDFMYKLGGDSDPLTKTVRDKLQLHGPRVPIELATQLMERQYILVIIDGFSDLSQESQSIIRPESADFPAQALVVTSQTDERFGGVLKTTIRLAERKNTAACN